MKTRLLSGFYQNTPLITLSGRVKALYSLFQLAFIFLLFSFSGQVWGQVTVNLPTSGSATPILAGQTALIYDDGGPNANYSNSVDSYIYITASPGQTITITGAYDTENYSTNADAIRIYSGDGITGTVRQGPMRGQNNWYTYTGGVGEGLTIRFQSDGSTRDYGFKFLVTYSDELTSHTMPNSGSLSVSCNTNTLLFDNGGRANDYTASTDGHTVFNATSNAQIRLMGVFRTEYNYDYIRIYDGVGTSGTLLRTYSGHMNDNNVHSGNPSGTGFYIDFTGEEGQSLTVRFSSDTYEHFGGFEIAALYIQPCCTTPTAYTVGGGGSCVASGTITLSGSQANVSYQLKKNGVNQGAPLPGNGAALSWAGQQDGTYTVVATGTGGSYCTTETAMSGSAALTVKPVISGANTICGGGTIDLNVAGEWSVADLPTGGSITTIGDERMHVFNNTDPTGFQTNTPVSAKVLVVGGGGGGGRRHAGGGGAGGVLYNATYNIAPGNYPVTVGIGGAGGTTGNSDQGAKGGNGENSVFGSMIAIGGGGGAGNENGPGNNGGSGGGGANETGGGTSISGQGNKGGNHTANAGSGCGGGGGGAPGANSATGSVGGDGLNFGSDFGTGVGQNGWFAGGGGGGNQAATQFDGGNGGGGRGGNNASATKNGSNGTANTGGGGGGGGSLGSASATNNGSGGNGGSGVVIVRYRVPKYEITAHTGTLNASNTFFENDLTGVLKNTGGSGTVTVRYTNEFGCSATQTITVTPQFTPGTIAAEQTICNNTTPVAFTQTAPTGSGSYAYQWQASTSLTGPWTDISGATSATYSETSNLTADKYYRRKVTDNGGCGGVAYSTPVTPTANLRLHYKFDNQVEPTSNLVPSNIATFSSFTGWSCDDADPANVTRTILPGQGYQGRDAVRIQKTAAATSGYFQVNMPFPTTGTAGTTYTASVKYKKQDAGTNFSIGDWAGPDGNIPTWNLVSDVPLDNGWSQRVYTQTYTNAQTTGFTFGINSTTSGKWIIFSDFQLEQKNHASPFTVGTSSSASITDYSGNGNHGTIALATAPAWVADNNNGVNGGAYQFDGGQYIDFPNPLSHQTNTAQEWTVSAWIKITDLNQTNQYLVSGMNNGLYTRFSTTTKPLLYLNSGTNDYYRYGQINKVEQDKWQHIVFTFQNSTGERHVYLNGVNIDDNGPNLTSLPSGILSTLRLGTNAKGLIDDVRIYDKMLSLADIKNLYEHSAALHVTVQAPINAGTVATNQTICYNTRPSAFTSTTAGSGDSRGVVTYRWEKAVSPFSTWSPISGATAATYTETANLTATTHYRRVTIVTLNGVPCERESASIIVTVRPQFTAGTIANTGQTICEGGNPSNIGSTTAASGGDGTITYKWQANGVDIAGSNSATYDPPAGLTATTVYTRWAKDNTCNIPFTQSANSWTVTIDRNPVLPTLTADYNGANNCWGREVALTATGGTLYGTAQYIYGTSSGGTQVSTATTNTTVTYVPTAASTNFYVGTTANGACPAQNLATGVTYALPTKNAVLSSNSSGTCYVSGSNPIHFYDASNNYIGSINPQGRTGLVTMSTSVSTPSIQGECTAPSDPKYRTAYLGRIVDVDGSGLSGSGNVDVVLAYSDAELSALQVQSGNGSGGSTPGNTKDDITSLSNPSLGITKVGGTGTLCTGNTVSYLSAGGGVLSVTPAISAARYVSFSVPSFSSFYIHGVNGSSPLPITLTSFTASCEDKVSLTWKTATETNVSHYEILRSRDGQQWEEAITVSAVGNSTTEQVYHATDATGIETMYYKLRSVDNDGTIEDFQPVSVTCNPTVLWSIHPVPVSVKATVTVTATETSDDMFMITDINGRVVNTQQVEIKEGTSIFELDLHRLSEGTYFIRMNQSDKYSPLKFIKVN